MWSGKKVSTEVLLKRIEHLEEQMAVKGEAMLWAVHLLQSVETVCGNLR